MQLRPLLCTFTRSQRESSATIANSCGHQNQRGSLSYLGAGASVVLYVLTNGQDDTCEALRMLVLVNPRFSNPRKTCVRILEKETKLLPGSQPWWNSVVSFKPQASVMDGSHRGTMWGGVQLLTHQHRRAVNNSKSSDVGRRDRVTAPALPVECVGGSTNNSEMIRRDKRHL